MAGPKIYDDAFSSPLAVDLFIDWHDGPAWRRRWLRNKSGWLITAEVELDTLISSHRRTIIAGITEYGDIIPKQIIERLPESAVSYPQQIGEVAPTELYDALDTEYWDFLGTCDIENLKLLRTKELEADAKIAKLEARGKLILEQADRYVADIRMQLRTTSLPADQQQLLRNKIALVEQKQDESVAWLLRQTHQIRDQLETFETAAFASITTHGTLEILSVLHWTARSSYQRTMRSVDLQICYPLRASDPLIVQPNQRQIESALAIRTVERKRFIDDQHDEIDAYWDKLEEKKEQDILDAQIKRASAQKKKQKKFRFIEGIADKAPVSKKTENLTAEQIREKRKKWAARKALFKM